MSKFSIDDIRKLYVSEAAKHGTAGTCTIQDIRTRNLEIDAIFSYLRDGQRLLEVGCGNGYVATQLVRRFDVDLDAFDFSADMIELAKRQNLAGARGRVRFSVGDILALDSSGVYDLIFSERCIQNLTSWEEQKRALGNIAHALKPGGLYVMEECFWTGLNNLNEARVELDLEPIAESWHNNYFHEDKTISFMEGIGCRYLDQNAFLSGFFFGSRVLLPALVPKNKGITFSSRLNDYFLALPPAGDFSPMKILRFGKVH